MEVCDRHRCFSECTQHDDVSTDWTKTVFAIKIFPYGSDIPIKVSGKFTAEIFHKKCYTVAENSEDTLLSCTATTELGLVQIINSISRELPLYCKHSKSLYEEQIIYKYSDRFICIGKLKGVQCTLHRDKSVKSVVQPHRRLPFHLCEPKRK